MEMGAPGGPQVEGVCGVRGWFMELRREFPEDSRVESISDRGTGGTSCGVRGDLGYRGTGGPRGRQWSEGRFVGSAGLWVMSASEGGILGDSRGLSWGIREWGEGCQRALGHLARVASPKGDVADGRESEGEALLLRGRKSTSQVASDTAV